MKQELTQQQTALKSAKNGLTSYLKTLHTSKFDTIEKTIDSELPSLVKMNKQFGSHEVIKAVAKMLIETVGFFNVPKLTDVQVKITVELICEEHYYLNFADIQLCFKNAMKGKYGELYNRIDGQVIMIWLNKYVEERFTISEERSYQKHSSLTSHEKERQYDGFVDKLWGEHIEQAARRKPNPSPITSNQKFNKKTKKWEVK